MNIFKTNNVNELLFPVKKIKETMPTNTANEFSIVVYPEAFPNGYKVNSVAKRYNLVDNLCFLILIDKLKEMNIDFEVEFEVRDYCMFTANFTLKSINDKPLAIEVSPGDFVYPRLSLRKSYNSELKYAFIFGFFRVICSNGLVIPVEELKHLNFNYVGKHTHRLNESISTLYEKIEAFQLFLENENILGNMKRLVNNTHVADYSERIEEVMNATNLPLNGRGRKGKGVEKKENVETIIAIAKAESAQLDQPMNDWLIYNAINSWIYNTNKKTNEVREVIDHKVMAYLLSN